MSVHLGIRGAAFPGLGQAGAPGAAGVGSFPCSEVYGGRWQWAGRVGLTASWVAVEGGFGSL